eukprot:358832-Chlamydomonas_euryale.AAC.2
MLYFTPAARKCALAHQPFNRPVVPKTAPQHRCSTSRPPFATASSCTSHATDPSFPKARRVADALLHARRPRLRPCAPAMQPIRLA